jgi:hypothetical protein
MLRRLISRSLTGLVLAAVLSACVVALAACGDDGDSAEAPRTTGTTSTAPAPANESAASGDEYPGVYAAAKEICGTGSRERVARNVRAASTRPRAIARAFARGYKPQLRRRAFRGCLAGLR